MKKFPLLISLLILANLVSAQIKIGENPQVLDSSSLLELESTTKALVISRVSETEMRALNPLQGAIVYNTDASCIFYYDGTNWNNLCAGSSTGNISWGAITGDLRDQTDLASQFQNYVDLTTAQSIAEEKTLTAKLTVDTGDVDAQIAEFLGRVKGEDGTAPEDFVTRLQLDAVAVGGHTGAKGSIFFAGANTQPSEDNANLYWNEENKQLRIGSFVDDSEFSLFSDNLTTLSIQGSVSKPIGYPRILTEEHHTTIISWSTWVTLPDPSTCIGRIYIIKTSPKDINNPTENTRVRIANGGGYNDSQSQWQTEFPAGSVTQLQSSGNAWEQIN
ncbi:hypothetical protein [Kriegella aquimaris]|uniref:Uncharacterized protein n=1 Tax=Kriegella aquimaris TaxID=192904 RepID=A0A1G9U5D0_9FLAO|nr:hypothetical protein [Kriegella aquimaris]SDM55156.1 hypothetical protein SAMN04488514_110125 [Kriegella aquimaris]